MWVGSETKIALPRSRDPELAGDEPQRVERVVGLVLAEDRRRRARRARSRTAGRRPPRSCGRRAACRRSRRTPRRDPRATGPPRAPAGPRTRGTAGRRTAPRRARRSRRPGAARRGCPAARCGTVAAPAATATTRPPMRNEAHEVADAPRVRPRDTSCTSGPSRTSTGRSGRSGPRTGVKPWRTRRPTPRASPGAWRAVRIGSAGRPRIGGRVRRRAAGAPPGRRPSAGPLGRRSPSRQTVAGRLVVRRAVVDGPVGVRVLLAELARPRAAGPGPAAGPVAGSRCTVTRKIVVATWRRIRSRSSS